MKLRWSQADDKSDYVKQLSTDGWGGLLGGEVNLIGGLQPLAVGTDAPANTSAEIPRMRSSC